jgi:outer membrane protein OmpA-like peptidoglycan-associated protein
MRFRGCRALVLLCFCSVTAVLVGCGELEYVPNSKWNYYHKPLPEAARAVDAAKAAGKDKECPAEFQAALKMKNDAFATYDACNTRLAIEQAKQAIAMVNALCPAKPTPPPAPAPPATPAPRIISFSASPSSIDKGKCSTLSWSTANVSSASIDEGVGSVDANGSKEVCPSASTRYMLTATGAGGSRTEWASVTVNAPAPAPATPIDRLTVHVNFDTNKSVIRKADLKDLRKALEFVRKYPGCSISVEGHTDSTGKPTYNQGLSERRAAAVKKYLLDNGVTSADKITSVGYGETRPIASNDTAEGKFQNRRVEIVILSK